MINDNGRKERETQDPLNFSFFISNFLLSFLIEKYNLFLPIIIVFFFFEILTFFKTDLLIDAHNLDDFIAAKNISVLYLLSGSISSATSASRTNSFPIFAHSLSTLWHSLPPLHHRRFCTPHFLVVSDLFSLSARLFL